MEQKHIIDTDEIPAAEKEHPFFYYYGQLVHQQNMLQDAVRTGTYNQAILMNKTNFDNKVVLDVGTGSGILAMFAVQAGAKKVYAVEASGMARNARKIIEHNNMSDKITVILGKVEEIELPEKVDVIISEPMGFMLVHERMLESYIIARQRFMKPNGLMMPTVGRLYCTIFSDDALYYDILSKSSFWNNKDFYGLRIDNMLKESKRENFLQSVVSYINPSCLLSDETCKHEIHFDKDTVEDLAHIEMKFTFTVNRTALLHGIAAWFDVLFNGSDHLIVLSTSPSAPGTHWYQCRLVFENPIAVNKGQSVSGTIIMDVNDNKSYNIAVETWIDNCSPRISTSGYYHLHDQYCYAGNTYQDENSYNY